jgi:hypothetical protein
MYSQVFNQDCIAGMAEHLQPNSVDEAVMSIPFADLFMYSGKKEDVGNCKCGVDIEALHWLKARKDQRELRGVQGLNRK